MKKTMVVLGVILALAVGAAWAGDKGESAEAKQTVADKPEADQVNPDTCEYKTAEQLLEEWRQEHREPVSVPDCPAANNDCSPNNQCGGSNSCGISGSGSSVDTGLTKCRTVGGSILNCTSSQTTVHVTTWPCSQCACCTSSCICPDVCSSVVRLTCGAFGGGQP